MKTKIDEKIEEGYYAIINGFNSVKHLVIIASVLSEENSPIEDKVFSGIVIGSYGDSSLNTITFKASDVEFFLDKGSKMDNIEKDYPELWI